MSHILFGEFNSYLYNDFSKNKIKSYGEKEDIYFWFGKEIDFYKDVNIMLKEQSILKNNITFCITSALQPKNSDDLLFPYDKYDSNTLFLNPDDRSVFNKICKENLNLFSSRFKYFLDLLKPDLIRVFITVGYDNDFLVKKCTLDEMIDDIYKQITISIGVASTIYELLV